MEAKAKEEADKKAKDYVVTAISALCGRSCGRDYRYRWYSFPMMR